jgi:uncharacterized membrane protein
MKFYLKVINPIVALLVLLICIHAATFDEGDFKPGEIIKGGFSAYFLAKGIFCSVTLFIVGRILLVIITRLENRNNKNRES